MMELMEQLFEEFGYTPSSDYMKNHKEETELFNKVTRGLFRFPDFINIKLAFYKRVLEQKGEIPPREILWLHQIVQRVGNIAAHIREEHKKEAHLLLSKINNKLIQETLIQEENKKDATFEKEK
jgi:hypothetical protein